MGTTHSLTRQGKRQFWQQHVHEWKESGLSQKAYCEVHSLALPAFGYWKRKFAQKKKAAPQFYPLTISTGNEANRNSTRTGLQVHLKNDRFRIEIGADFSPEALKNLITILEQM